MQRSHKRQSIHLGLGGRNYRKKRCISLPHHFNKAIGKENFSSISNDIEKANYFKSYIKSCDKYKTDYESNESNSSGGSDNDGSCNDSCNR